MNRFGELLASLNAKPATVIHAGSGSCKEYDLYKALGAERIILLEPNLQLAAQARDKFNGSTDVTIVDQAVATMSGRNSLNIISNPRFSSLLPPAELIDFYPNITITDKIEIETVTLEELCKDVNVDDKKNNLLVAELQGLEKEVFPSTAKDILNKFKWILIRSSEHKLYEPLSETSQKGLAQAMRDAGYTVFLLKEYAPPHTNILCIRNEAVIAYALLKEREAELIKSIVVLKHKLAKHKTDEEERAGTYKQQIDSINKLLQTNSDELAQAFSQIESVKREKETLEQTKSDELAQAFSQVESVKREKETLEQTKSDELAQACSQIESVNTEKEQLTTEITMLTNEVSDRTIELREMHQTLRINNKLMLKSNADLNDLQNQYKVAVQHQERQHKLLCELKEKLGHASELYRSLNLQDLVLDGDKLIQSDPDKVGSLKDDDAKG